MYSDETIPIRVPKRVFKLLHKLKARKMQITGNQLSNGELIAQSVEEAYMKSSVKPKHSIMELSGFIKGGKKSNATKDLDEVLYGGDPNE